MKTAILHYSAPPVVGGVEAVIGAHAHILKEGGYPVSVIAGAGQEQALPEGVEFICIPEMDSQHPKIQETSKELEEGKVSPLFEEQVSFLQETLFPILCSFDNVIIHNIFTKHFNLPLTAALNRIKDKNETQRWIAWCHDSTWIDPHSHSKVSPGYPWDFIRSYRSDITYVTISRSRQQELAGLYGCSLENIRVIYNCVNPRVLLGLSSDDESLLESLDLWQSDLILLMPVRVTQAKDIEYALSVMVALKDRGIRPKLIVTGPSDPHNNEEKNYNKNLLEMRRRLQLEQEVCFVYKPGPEPGKPFTFDLDTIGSVYRISDLLFMPSHREGFGMPMLEAGFLGLPVTSPHIPAADEIGGQDIIFFSADTNPSETAGMILGWAYKSSVHQLRKRVRNNFTWQAIFNRDILPLLTGE